MPRSLHRGARTRIALLTACACLAATATVHAATPSMKVSGSLRGAAGMTLLALSPSGTAVQQKLGASGRFSLTVPRGRGTTLQLVTAGGRYFGPVVLASKKGKAYSALAPAKSVKLGALRLRAGFGVARDGGRRDEVRRQDGGNVALAGGGVEDDVVCVPGPQVAGAHARLHDMGQLHYGLTGTTPDGSREVACAGYYSGLAVAHPDGRRRPGLRPFALPADR
jgi:hypothetical protein